MEWLRRICDRATRLSAYTDEADNWETCAIGEAQDALGEIPAVATALRGRVGPNDLTLDRHGMAFWRAVKADNRKNALRAYIAIQRRIAALVKVK